MAFAYLVSAAARVTRGIDRSLLLGAALLGLLGAEGCTPSIGDRCTLSTDCSISGDRLCDNSQPDGYCTVFDCAANSCPDDAACVLFHPSVQGCPYDDRALARTARTFCMKTCSSDGKCRDGYVCRDPQATPWNGQILDDDTARHVCIVPADTSTIGGVARTDDGGGDVGERAVTSVAEGANVCFASRPDASMLFDATSTARTDASAADGSTSDAADDAADDANDGAVRDGALEASPPEAGTGASLLDAGTDATLADATTD